MTLEQAIKNAIKGKGYTLDSAAKKLKMSRRTLYNHIGAAKIDAKFIQNVNSILEIDINKIILKHADLGTLKRVVPSDLPKLNPAILDTGDSFADWKEQSREMNVSEKIDSLAMILFDLKRKLG